MPSLLEAVRGVFNGSEDVLFLNDVLRQYRETRKVYAYEYCEEDKEVLRSCATDWRPFTYAFLPSGLAYWGTGRLAKSRFRQLGGVGRAGLALARLLVALELFRVGYLVGSYQQGIDCTRRLVALRSPLGGELAAIIRGKDPLHPLLRFERPPVELGEDGERPRIASEANRQARMAALRRELAQARRGERVDRASEQADERLYQILQSREDTLGEIRRGGGAAAAAAAGRLEAAVPQAPPGSAAEYEAAAARSSGGLVITDQPPSLRPGPPQPPALRPHGPTDFQDAQMFLNKALLDEAEVAHGRRSPHAAELEAQPPPGSLGSQPGAAAGGDGDPLAMLLGGDGGSWAGELGGEAQAVAAGEQRAGQQQGKRRRGWWRRRAGSSADDP